MKLPSDQYSTKALILENGGVELLVQLITDPDPLVQQNTLQTIELLSSDCQCRISLDEANVSLQPVSLLPNNLARVCI